MPRKASSGRLDVHTVSEDNIHTSEVEGDRRHYPHHALLKVHTPPETNPKVRGEEGDDCASQGGRPRGKEGHDEVHDPNKGRVEDLIAAHTASA